MLFRSKLFAETWDAHVVHSERGQEIIRGGYKKVGLVPFDPKMVTENAEVLKLSEYKCVFTQGSNKYPAEVDKDVVLRSLESVVEKFVSKEVEIADQKTNKRKFKGLSTKTGALLNVDETLKELERIENEKKMKANTKEMRRREKIGRAHV